MEQLFYFCVSVVESLFCMALRPDMGLFFVSSLTAKTATFLKYRHDPWVTLALSKYNFMEVYFYRGFYYFVLLLADSFYRDLFEDGEMDIDRSGEILIVIALPLLMEFVLYLVYIYVYQLEVLDEMFIYKTTYDMAPNESRLFYGL